MAADPRHARLLTPADLELLVAAAGPGGAGVGPDRLRADPAFVEALLASPALHRLVFGMGDRDPLLVASPYLVFSVLVHQVARELEATSFVEERLGPGRTVPVFDVATLREWLARPVHRAFLAELLASYTRVASGTVWQRTGRGWRRRRYSELDPLRLAQMLEVVPASQRSTVCRRLGDLALFLAGVFPEHVESHPLQPRHLDRIRRLLDATGLGGPAAPPDELLLSGGPQRGLWLLEWLGRRAYGLAAGGGGAAADLPGLVEGFGRARRVLNMLTRRHLYPARERWFPRAET
ncbi:MAG TPA: hypothetical protein VKF59_18495 [Candidatus Dormibacteraeota bacterium]|nr:hypothetical protein [Candidatus Dormibacteraeota bacterium]